MARLEIVCPRCGARNVRWAFFYVAGAAWEHCEECGTHLRKGYRGFTGWSVLLAQLSARYVIFPLCLAVLCYIPVAVSWPDSPLAQPVAMIAGAAIGIWAAERWRRGKL